MCHHRESTCRRPSISWRGHLLIAASGFAEIHVPWNFSNVVTRWYPTCTLSLHLAALETVQWPHTSTCPACCQQRHHGDGASASWSDPFRWFARPPLGSLLHDIALTRVSSEFESLPSYWSRLLAIYLSSPHLLRDPAAVANQAGHRQQRELGVALEHRLSRSPAGLTSSPVELFAHASSISEHSSSGTWSPTPGLSSTSSVSGWHSQLGAPWPVRPTSGSLPPIPPHVVATPSATFYTSATSSIMTYIESSSPNPRRCKNV